MVVGRFRSMHRLWLLVLVCALLEFGGTTPSTFAAENLTVWVRTNNVDLFKAIAAEYIKENEGVEIEVTPDGGAVEKLTVAVLGGVAPDLVEIGGTQAPMLALDGLIQPITRFAEQDGLSVKDFWPTTILATPAAKIWSVGSGATARRMSFPSPSTAPKLSIRCLLTEAPSTAT